jgi:hypothetical protein
LDERIRADRKHLKAFVVSKCTAPQEAAMPKVYALKDHVRRSIFHPLGRIKFNVNGEAEWPLDQFTIRRVKDGDISLEPPPKKVSPTPTTVRKTETKASM